MDSMNFKYVLSIKHTFIHTDSSQGNTHALAMPASKKGALNLSPAQYKQLVQLCHAVSAQQDGGGYGPRAQSMGQWYREMYDVPIWVKDSAQHGAEWWDSMKGIFDRAKKSEAGQQAMGQAKRVGKRVAQKGLTAVKKRARKEATKRGLGSQFDMASGLAEGAIRRRTNSLIDQAGAGHCGAGHYDDDDDEQDGGAMYPGGY